MSATWEYCFDDGSGTCAILIGYPTSICGTPPKHARLSGSWQATVTTTGAMELTSIDMAVTDIMIPLTIPNQATSWIQLDSPTLSLQASTPHPHLSSLPALNKGQIDLTNRFTQLSWGVKLTSPTLSELELDDIVITYHESGYLYQNHDYGALGGSGVVTAPTVLSGITVLTNNAMRKVNAPDP